LVIKSPGGIKGLHYPLNTAYGIRGTIKTEADKIFAKINKELIVDRHIYDHWYQNDDDLLLFDNSITLHRRLRTVPGRLAYRLQHDYNELQNEPWQPYFQPEFAGRYLEETRRIAKTFGSRSFKISQLN